jgi:ferric-dicitrate binding protein FerR (iron transport regulator)
MQLLTDPELAPDVERLVSDCYDQLPVTFALPGENADNIFQLIINSNNAVVDTPRSPFRLRRMMARYAAAAAIILFVSAAGWLFLIRTPKRDPATTSQKTMATNDVAPGGNKAVLTLADGSNITLDSAGNGVLAQQGNAQVSKTNDGQLVYNITNEKPTEVLYNTLNTPRGGQYQLVLPDGSKVWLNAASSIRYPATFSGSVRQVDITGEAYFEIVKDASKPFHVRTGTQDVEVLGTHFNVNAYGDEEAVRTTLLEGSVKVSKDAASVIIKPGEQAVIASHSPFTIDHSPDIDQVMAWKNGMFTFNGADIHTIMRQITRWYDVDVVFEGDIKGTFHAEIGRNTNVSNVFRMLETTGAVHFKIDGKKIVVTQ